MTTDSRPDTGAGPTSRLGAEHITLGYDRTRRPTPALSGAHAQ